MYFELVLLIKSLSFLNQSLSAMPVKKEIIYPYFLECCQYCDDVFWENVFEELAYGKPPYGTYISKGFLTCSYKNKEFLYKIERKEDAKILYEDIYKLLTEKLGILSQKEKAQKRLVFYEMEKTIRQSRQDWASIRKKNIKDVMYEKYVIDMKKKHSLTIKQCKYLLSLIMIAIMFKTITTKDIVYKDDKIQLIEGIEFSEGEIILKRPLILPTANKLDCDEDEVEEVPPSKLLSNNWERYLKSLRLIHI